MANPKKALPENIDGLFYVDSSCINCGVSRNYASGLFGDTGEFAFVKKQPVTADELMAARQALLSCPVAAIGTREKTDLGTARDSFPLQMTDNVFLNGYNHRKSYGAHSYFIRATFGNWLIDSPRFLPDLVERFEAMGGIRYIFLTHSDDVGDAHPVEHDLDRRSGDDGIMDRHLRVRRTERHARARHLHRRSH